MISFKMVGNFDHIRDRIRHWLQIDPLPLAREIEQILIEENREWLLRGIDAYGEPFEEVKRSTVKRGRGGGEKGRPQSRGGGGYGPPLVPRMSNSRLITGFAVEIVAGNEGSGNGGYIIRAGWPGLDWLKYHTRGSPNANIPVRQVAGFRDSTNAQIQEAIDRFVLKFTGV